jgi:TolB protein
LRSWGMVAAGLLVVTMGSGCGDKTSKPDVPTVRQLTDDAGRDFSPAWSPDGRNIAFFSNRDGRDRVWVVPAIGGAAVRLSDMAVWIGPTNPGPQWSPDGTRIAFLSNATGRSQVVVAPYPEGDPIPLTNDLQNKSDLQWSPDGTRILFVSGNEAKTIWSISVGGGAADQITFGGYESSPRYSPDGDRIAYVYGTAGTGDVYMVPAAGGDVARLTLEPATYTGLQWSPDGSRVAVISNRKRITEQYGYPHIWMVFVEGAQARQITSDHRWIETSFSWSPDGGTLIFTRQGEAGDLWTVPTAGGDPVRITYDNAQAVGCPRWSPSGTQIAFESTRAGNSDIYILRID